MKACLQGFNNPPKKVDLKIGDTVCFAGFDFQFIRGEVKKIGPNSLVIVDWFYPNIVSDCREYVQNLAVVRDESPPQNDVPEGVPVGIMRNWTVEGLDENGHVLVSSDYAAAFIVAIHLSPDDFGKELTQQEQMNIKESGSNVSVLEEPHTAQTGQLPISHPPVHEFGDFGPDFPGDYE